MLLKETALAGSKFGSESDTSRFRPSEQHVDGTRSVVGTRSMNSQSVYDFLYRSIGLVNLSHRLGGTGNVVEL